MAGPKTALGDAMGLGITLFERSEVKERVMIALTDGNDTGSRVPPPKAARIASDQGITVHTIAFGDPSTVGEEKLDEDALKSVADITGGRYFYAADRDELESITRELDRIETRKIETISYRPKRDLFHWPLALILILSLGYHLLLSIKALTGKHAPPFKTLERRQ
jgi:Ca-activated chloride channel family protein